MRAEPALLLLVLATGCIDDLLEAPYVLATGLGEGARTLSPSAARTMIVAGAGGVIEVDGEGQPRRLRTAPAIFAVGHKGWVAVADMDGLGFHTTPASGGLRLRRHLPLAGAIDGQAWCDGTLLALTGASIVRIAPDAAEPVPWAAPPGGARRLTLGDGGHPCERTLVATGDTLLSVAPDDVQVVAEGLVDLRAVALDAHGRTWVVHGAPPVVARIDQGRAVTFARHLGDVVDAHFGTGGLLHPDNLYLLNADGSVDYLRVTPP